MYIEQNRRDWIGNELCQWLGWGRAWHLAMESCCGGKRTFNEEPTEHWPLDHCQCPPSPGGHSPGGDTLLSASSWPNCAEQHWNWQNSQVKQRYAFCLIHLCQFEPQYWGKSTLSRCPLYQPHIWPISLDWLPGRHRPAGTTAGQCFHARQG